MTHMLFSCKEHIEEILDQFVDQYEEAPDLYPLGYGSWQEELDDSSREVVAPVLKEHPACTWCGAKADYLLLKVPVEGSEDEATDKADESDEVEDAVIDLEDEE